MCSLVRKKYIFRNSSTTIEEIPTQRPKTVLIQRNGVHSDINPIISVSIISRTFHHWFVVEKNCCYCCVISRNFDKHTNKKKNKRKNTTKQVERINARASFNIRYNSNGYGHIESGESDYIRYVVLYVIGGGSRRRFDKRMVRGTRIQRWTCGSPHTGKQQSKHAPKTRMQQEQIEKRKKYLYIRGRHSFPASVMLCSQLWSLNGHTWKLKLNNTTNI